MAVDSRFALSSWGTHMLPFRSWKAILIVGLTLLIIIPLYQLGDHEGTTYYKQYIYDHIHQYLDHEDGVYNNTLYQEGNDVAVHSQYNFSTPCAGFPDTTGIMLVMKTGATEAFDKLPTHLLTSMQCLPDFLIFSDLEQQIGRFHLYDALDRVEETVRKAHKPFELYEAQLKCPVAQTYCTSDMSGGWDLDKYKFIHMLVQSWEMRPDQDWYVFGEADTYIFWPALTHFLRERSNPKEDVYIGSVAMINGKPFAHGGSGYVLSGALVKKIVEDIPNVGAKYDEQAGKECCGDLIVALAAEQAGTKVKQAHPMFNGEKPNTLPYGPGHWCEPLLTMHHMGSEEVAAVWQYEQTRTIKDFTQVKDMYHTFFAPNLISYRDNWTNLSDDVCYIAEDEESQDKVGDHEKSRQKAQGDKNAIEKLAHLSPSDCANVCEASKLDISAEEYDKLESQSERSDLIKRKYDQMLLDDEGNFAKDRQCFQWRYSRGACCTSKSFKFGQPKKEDKNNKVSSGWFVQGINDWIDAAGQCDGISWREPH